MTEQTFSHWLRKKMVDHDLNATGLGHIIGVSQVAVSRWTRGDNTPNLDNVMRLAEYFDVEPAELYALTNRDPIEPEQLNHINERLEKYEINADYSEAMALYDQLQPHDRERILVIMRAFLEQQNAQP